MASLTALYARRGELVEQISNVVAERDSAQRALSRAQSDLQFLTDPNARFNREQQIAQSKAAIANADRQLVSLNAQLAEVDAQIAAEQQKQGAVQSSGQTTAQAQAARDDAASPGAPPPAALEIDPDTGRVSAARDSIPTNAEGYTENETTGTDGPIRRAVNLQSTPAIVAQPGGIDSEGGDFTPSQEAGAAKAGDDATGGTGVRAAINNIFGGDNARIVPQDNILDKFASYTYNISLYIMSTNDYKKLLNSKTKNIAGFQLLMSSGGAPQAGGTVRPIDPEEAQQAADGNSAAIQQPNLGRNQFFPLDYYIDDVKMTSLIPGKGTGAAHNVSKINFKVFEPNGISFIDNLFSACQQYVALQGGTGKQNYAAQNYLMVIRFYGYDQYGNLVKVGKSGTDASGTGAIVEKFIPFQFSAIKFKIANRITEYDCECVCPQNAVGIGPARGVIPYNVELTSTSLKELLMGNLGYSSQAGAGSAKSNGRETPQQTDARLNKNYGLPPVGTDVAFDTSLYSVDDTSGTFGSNNEIATALGTAPVVAGNSPTQNQAPPKANAASNPTIVSGLAEALNQFQAEIKKKGIIEYEDTYKIVIVEPALAEAKVVPPGETNLKQPPMTQAQTANQAKNPATQAVNNNAKGTKITAGTSIVQFIDQVIRSSTYVYDQQTKIIDPKTKEVKPNGTPAQTMAWYRIGMQAEPKGPNFYDRKRQDYAYNITYQINIYAVNDVKSDWFPTSKLRGWMKEYDYWFTGTNTQILDFTQDYNYLYYIVMNTKAPPRSTTSNFIEVERAFYQPNSNQTNQGQENDVNEPSANAADYLYSPADHGKIKLKIVGDPAWIFQGETWSGIQGLKFNYGPFLPDGTINFEGQEVLFKVSFNRPTDYDLNTGLQDPGASNYRSNRSSGVAGDARQQFLYKATEIHSTFSRGRFEQELNGVLMMLPLPTTAAKQQIQDQQQRNTTASQQQAVTRQPVNATYQEGSRGTLDVDLVGGAEPNYEPASLAKVLDSNSKAPPTVVSGSQWDAEGFGSELNGTTEASPPTSYGQTVGPASAGSAAIASQGGAAGANSGPPVVNLYLDNGQVVQVTSQSQINNYRVGGFASAQAANAATVRLNAAQQATNSPVAATPVQRTKRDF